MRVPGPRAVTRDVDALRNDADARRRDEYTIALPFFDDLGIAGNDRHRGIASGLRHRGNDAPQIRERKAFLQHEARGQVQRAGARHRDVVQRAVNRQAADVATGKEQRRHDVTVGRDDDPAGRNRDARRIVARAQPCVVEFAHEQLLDELRHGASAAAMTQVDPAVLEVDGPDVVAARLAHDAASTTGISLKRP